MKQQNKAMPQRKKKIVKFIFAMLLILCFPLLIALGTILINIIPFDPGKFYLQSYEKNQENDEISFQLIKKIVALEEGQSDSQIRSSNTTLIRLLKNHITQHPDDKYILFYTYTLGTLYKERQNTHLARYYFQNVVNKFIDATGQRTQNSKNILLYRSLLALSDLNKNPFNLVFYHEALLQNFTEQLANPDNNLYLLGQNYDAIAEWDKAYANYQTVLLSPRHTLQQDAYGRREKIFFRLERKRAKRKTVVWNNAEEARRSIRYALYNYNNNNAIKRLRSPGFFTAHWNESLLDPNAHVPNFDITAVVARSNLSVTNEFSPFSTEHSKLWKTTGWGRIPTWYFVFSQIREPDRPEINGKWEWSGIYFGVGSDKYVPFI